jgi:hypothetical protein
MSKISSIIFAAAIAAAFTMPAEAAKKPVAARPAAINAKAAIAKAKNAIAWTMKDPESVRWRRAWVASNGNVCIEVNAKNSYGGYTGYTVYLYNSVKGSLVSGESDYAGMYCRIPRVMPNAVIVNAQ